MKQGMLFTEAEIKPSLDELVAQSRASIERILRQDKVLVQAYSGGKDSSVVADLVLDVARELVASGESLLVVSTTSSTRVDNPEIELNFRAELAKMEAYAARHGIEFRGMICEPSILSTFQVKVLSGRGLPSYANGNADCSMDLKVNSQARARAKLFKEMKDRGYKDPVTCLGTRLVGESQERTRKMLERGENAITPVRNKLGELILSPICNWSTDDVWEYLVTRGAEGNGYSDMKEVQRIYAHAEGQGCAIVAESVAEGVVQRRSGTCSARHGCWTCLRARDRSLENMIAFDPRYQYAAGLNKLNKFLRAIQTDYSRRHWVGRTIKEGYIKCAPDTLHPTTLRQLFRMMLTLDFEEKVRSAAAGVEPMFEILSAEMILVIDMLWSLNGIAKPFAAWADYDAVYRRGVRYEIPEIEPVPDSSFPEAKFLFVGDEWEATLQSPGEMHGLRDAYLESLTDEAGCQPELRELKDGRMVWDITTSSEFEVNLESLEMILAFELDNLIAKHHDPLPATGITYGYYWYIQYGVIQVAASQVAKHDEVLRRTAHKASLGLCLEYDIDVLMAKASRFADMPENARKAWMRYATVSSAQSDMLDELEREDAGEEIASNLVKIDELIEMRKE